MEKINDFKSCFFKINKIEKVCPDKNLPTNVYSSFIHNCQTLKAMKMSFSSWQEKVMCQTMEYLLNTKKPWKDMEEV